MLAPFPPNSRDTLLIVSAAPLVTATPALVDPVNGLKQVKQEKSQA